MCPPVRAHWHHLANTIEPVLRWPTRVHNPNGKLIASAVFAQLTAVSAYTLQWAPCRPFPQKLPLPIGDLDPHLTRFLGPIRAHNPNSISIGSAVFAHCTDDHRVYLYRTLQWDALSPSTLSFPWGNLEPHLIHGSPGPPQSSTQKIISIASDVFAGLTSVTDRQTTLLGQ